MKKGGIMAISGFALLLGFAAMQYSASGNASLGIDESNDSAQNGENPSASGRSTKLKEVPEGRLFKYDTRGVGQDYSVSPQKSYDHISKCYARKSFENFFNSMQKDPSSIFNDKVKLESMSDLKRSYLERDLDMMVSAKKECSKWDEVVDRELASQQVYGAALNAAISGEDDATACLIFSPWPLPDKNSKQFFDLQNSFKDNANELVQRGVKNGNWKVVAANVLAFRERTGLAAVLPGDDATGYYFSRLGQLGSNNEDLASSFGYDASRFAKNLSAETIKRSEDKAEQDFKAFFGNSRLTEDDTTVRCGK
ncbi:hypothetical protein CPBF426_27380 [Xanthomonas arboricola pv. juglandis]|nr:hypothetical protein CPBF426_27380 [Xanthomonas arboricola pv. juglandis]